MGKIFYHGRFRGDFMGGTQSDEIVAEMLAQRDTARRASPPRRRTAAPPHRRTAAPPHRRTAEPTSAHLATLHRPLTPRPCACQLMNAPDDKGEKKDGKEEL